MHNKDNGAAILREAAYTQGYRAGKDETLLRVQSAIHNLIVEKSDYKETYGILLKDIDKVIMEMYTED